MNEILVHSLFRVSRYTDEPNHLGHYELLAETGVFKTQKKKKQRKFFDKSIKVVQENVIIGILYRSGECAYAVRFHVMPLDDVMLSSSVKHRLYRVFTPLSPPTYATCFATRWQPDTVQAR